MPVYVVHTFNALINKNDLFFLNFHHEGFTCLVNNKANHMDIYVLIFKAVQIASTLTSEGSSFYF